MQYNDPHRAANGHRTSGPLHGQYNASTDGLADIPPDSNTGQQSAPHKLSIDQVADAKTQRSLFMLTACIGVAVLALGVKHANARRK